MQSGQATPWTHHLDDLPEADRAQVDLDAATTDLQITYYSPTSGRSERRITPKALRYLKDGDLAVVAQCHLRQEERSFAFPRMLEVKIADGDQPPMSQFRLERHFRHEIGRLEARAAALNGTPTWRHGGEAPRHQAGQTGPVGKTPKALQLTRAVDFSDALGEITSKTTGMCMPLLSARKQKEGNILFSAYRPDTSVRCDIDPPVWFLESLRGASAHEQIKIIGAQPELKKLVVDLWSKLDRHPAVGHKHMSLRIAVRAERGTKNYSKIMVAIDDFWLRDIPLAPTGIGQQLAYRLNRISDTAPGKFRRWVIVTRVGLFSIYAPRAEDAARKLVALYNGDPGIQDICAPIGPPDRGRVDAALEAMISGGA